MIDIHNISESIEAIGSIVDELPVDAAGIAGFRAQYENILLRSRDPYFYLSTIGDFSSGKSTLINTIIKRKLLKVAHTATTAVPTYIRRGKSNRVVVNVKCNDGNNFDLTSETDVSKLENKFGISLPQQIDERISLVTADKKLSPEIKEVDVELPDDALANGLCIIDTPGVNPGADFAEKHADITKYILNEKADAIIVLFPAYQAYTQSFEDFLKNNAEYFMKDAIFVVTMMDTVDEEEREDVIRFVKTNLRNNFRLKDPQVLSCSAMRSDKDPYWANNFMEFEQSLMDTLARNRQRIITERLIKLSNELLNSIQSEMLSQKNELEKKLSVLQTHSVPNLISVLADNKQASDDKLLKVKAAHDAAIKRESSYLEAKIKQKVSSSLDACSTRSAVTKYVNDSLASDIEAACKDIYAVSARHTQRLNEELSSAVSGMIEELKIYYGEIGSVLPESTSLSAAEQKISVSDKLAGLGGMIGSYEGKIDVATAIGGAGLAALILTGLGPIGWIIGGAAALIGGDRLFVDSARSKVRVSVSEKIPGISESVARELCNGMQKNCREAKKTLESKQKELVSQYQPIYEKLEKQFNLENLRLSLRILHSEEIQKRIKTVLQQMNKIQGEIAE